ncbi:hypothetical protein AKJ16_DCAP06596 [Drosera capensis]
MKNQNHEQYQVGSTFT